jgi:hypothetical protein
MESQPKVWTNVIATHMTPAMTSLDIEDGRRTVAGIFATLKDRRLAPATVAQYRTWMDQRKCETADGVGREAAAC